MQQQKLFCPECAELIERNASHCPHCGENVQFDPNVIMDEIAERTQKSSIIPWGLLILFALYFAGAYAYLNYGFYGTPEYKAALHFKEGEAKLGNDDGASASVEQLNAAFDAFTAGLLLVPDADWGYQRIETIARRFQERGLQFNRDQQLLVDALSKKRALIQQARKPVLFVGIRDIWDIESLEAWPEKFIRFSVYAAGLILLLWVFNSWRIRRHYERVVREKQERRQANDALTMQQEKMFENSRKKR